MPEVMFGHQIDDRVQHTITIFNASSNEASIFKTLAHLGYAYITAISL